jgi:hypothetical protein
MPSIDVKWLFSVLGPLFLLLALWSYAHAGRWAPQGRTWAIIGVIFCAVAAWLWWSAGFTLRDFR